MNKYFLVTILSFFLSANIFTETDTKINYQRYRINQLVAKLIEDRDKEESLKNLTECQTLYDELNKIRQALATLGNDLESMPTVTKLCREEYRRLRDEFIEKCSLVNKN